MNKIKLILSVSLFSFVLLSCEETCVRCENTATQDEQSQCFSDEDERLEYLATQEALGYTCN